MRFDQIRIRLEELPDKSLEGNEIDVRVWIKKLKVNLDATLPNKF